MTDKPFARIAWHGRINFIDTKAVMLSDGESDIANILQWKDGDTAFDSGPDDAQRICDCINAAVASLVAAARKLAEEARGDVQSIGWHERFAAAKERFHE